MHESAFWDLVDSTFHLGIKSPKTSIFIYSHYATKSKSLTCKCISHYCSPMKLQKKVNGQRSDGDSNYIVIFDRHSQATRLGKCTE